MDLGKIATLKKYTRLVSVEVGTLECKNALEDNKGDVEFALIQVLDHSQIVELWRYLHLYKQLHVHASDETKKEEQDIFDFLELYIEDYGRSSSPKPKKMITCQVCSTEKPISDFKKGSAMSSSCRPAGEIINGVQVLDFRSPREKRLAAEATRGVSLPQEAADMLSHLMDAGSWGSVNGFPLHEKYPHYDKIRAVGNQIHARDGLEGMQRVYYWVQSKNAERASFLNYMWDGVGSWRA